MWKYIVLLIFNLIISALSIGTTVYSIRSILDIEKLDNYDTYVELNYNFYGLFICSSISNGILGVFHTIFSLTICYIILSGCTGVFKSALSCGSCFILAGSTGSFAVNIAMIVCVTKDDIFKNDYRMASLLGVANLISFVTFYIIMSCIIPSLPLDETKIRNTTNYGSFNGNNTTYNNSLSDTRGKIYPTRINGPHYRCETCRDTGTIKCSLCRGSGLIDVYVNVTCDVCKGTGWKDTGRYTMANMPIREQCYPIVEKLSHTSNCQQCNNGWVKCQESIHIYQ